MKCNLRDEALNAYSFALQFAPQNGSVASKLERLAVSQGASPHPGPTLARGEVASRRLFNHDHLLIILNIVFILILGFSVACFELFSGSFQGVNYTPIQLIMLISGAFSAGGLLAFHGNMRKLRDEFFQPINPRRSPVSIGVFTLLFSFICFYLSFIVYLVAGIKRQGLSGSVMRAFFTTFLYVTVLWAFHQRLNEANDSGWLLVLGGNAAFPAVIAGWAIGDKVRLLEE